MSNTRWRQEWLHAAGRAGLAYQDACSLSRYARTLHRLAELACSSEAADRDRVPCPAASAKIIGCKERICTCHDRTGWRYPGSYADGCSACGCYRDPTQPCLCIGYGSKNADGSHGTVPRYMVQDARTERQAERILAEYPGFKLETQGDPRGAVLSVVTPDGRKLAVW